MELTQPTDQPPRLLVLEEAADRLGIPAKSLARAARRRELATVRLAGATSRVYVTQEALAAFVAARTIPAREPVAPPPGRLDEHGIYRFDEPIAAGT